jgi:hypothetical protein
MVAGTSNGSKGLFIFWLHLQLALQMKSEGGGCLAMPKSKLEYVSAGKYQVLPGLT